MRELIITANQIFNGSPYDGELIPITAVALLPTLRPLTIISDCKGLCDKVTTLKNTFFCSYLLEDQPESHKVSLPRDGSSAGILMQAIYPHLPRLALIHQEAHVEKRKRDRST
jgi:hypothetical protein